MTEDTRKFIEYLYAGNVFKFYILKNGGLSEFPFQVGVTPSSDFESIVGSGATIDEAVADLRAKASKRYGVLTKLLYGISQ